MPNLDVSDVLDDPDFMTSFTVRRTTQTVNSYGETVETTTTSTQTGVVFPTSGKELLRNSDGENIGGDVMVVTKYLLTSGQDNVEADIVIWGGHEWTVMRTKDYSEYGQGFIQANCYKRTLR